ncbi:MAG TPA: HyaD/HybD family hydrogenase maturation endopeptidase [Gemmatimonadales bacterium]|nr:HyaD/HybD family hydrogenase maturation endopeptidase [Gemmatimonadales bacterium]
MNSAVPSVLVIGLGNPLMRDDGFGLAVLERLRDSRRVPPEVELVDGGTWGIRLLPLIENAKRVLFLDAVDHGAAPGTPVVLRGPDLPHQLSLKLSSHQIDLREMLAVALLRGTSPADLTAVGAQPARVEPGTELTPALADRIDEVVALAMSQLEAWGHPCSPAEDPACA